MDADDAPVGGDVGRPVRSQGHYARFLAQVSLAPWVEALADADPSATSSIREVFTALAEQLDGLPPAVLRTRLALGMMLTVRALAACEHSLATAAEASDDGPDAAQRQVALLTANLVDSFVGSLRAPVSPATRALLPAAEGAPAAVLGHDWSWPMLLGAEAGR